MDGKLPLEADLRRESALVERLEIGHEPALVDRAVEDGVAGRVPQAVVLGVDAHEGGEDRHGPD